MIKQGDVRESILWAVLVASCIVEGATHLYSRGGLQGVMTLPLSDIAKLYGWVLLAAFCSLMLLWTAAAHEVITVKDGQLLVEIRIGLRGRIYSRTYLIQRITNLRLRRHTLPKSNALHWTACFDYDRREKELSTRFYTQSDGHYFLDECLKPMLTVAVN